MPKDVTIKVKGVTSRIPKPHKPKRDKDGKIKKPDKTLGGKAR